jgi:hypothetical protein
MAEVHSALVENGYQLEICNRKVEGLFRKKISFDAISDWNDGVAQLDPITAAVIDELTRENKLTGTDLSTRQLDFAAAALLHNVDAEALNLLPPFPYQLEVQSCGTLGISNFQIQYQAIEGGIRTLGAFSDGVFATPEQRYRIAGMLYSIIETANRLNQETDPEKKIAHFAALRLFLPDGEAASNVSPESFLLRIRVAHVTAIGLSPNTVDGNMSFDPIPMRRRDPEDHAAGAELAITPVANEKFAEEFRTQMKVNSTYAIGSGQYLFIDPSVRTALRVVKQKQNASLEERMAFLMSPAQAITDAYKGEGIENADVPVGDTIFFETSEYSERITGIGEWIPPQLPFLEKQENNWLPERFSIVLSGKLVTGEPEDVRSWIEQVKSALASNKSEVVLGDVSIPTNTPGLLETLKRLQPPEAKPDTKKKDERDTTRLQRRIKIFQTKSNFIESEFKKHFIKRKIDDVSAPVLRAQFKAHQEAGLNWLTNAYVAGWPGVLLADDMGLGKTLQSLAFLVLLRREGIVRKGHPALVVAPTSLLRNWKDEHDKHTLAEGLGEPLIAFGNRLGALKIGRAEKDGVILLDAVQIAESNWVLTTYETIRDYHMSFARVPFSVAVLDEIQKAKNPRTRINATLRALNIDFIVSMTGTPVENSISDIWAVTDITAPGYFAPLKEFIKAYGKMQDDAARQRALEKLSLELLEPAEIEGCKIPPFALRRLKEDVAKDLPPKLEGPMIRTEMPLVQAERYAEVSAATQVGHTNILRALHDFRSISLHPVDPDAVMGGLTSCDEYIKMSARLSQAFEKLEQIAARNEKALIFVNNRRMQTVLSRLIERKFGCRQPEYIRGDTIPGQRQEIVNRFSNLQGFAVLILSPRAAGVGLNIVAANHVIHLDRWWNPAVEDQCTDRAYRIGATKDVFVYKVGAIHPVLKEKSYDIILDDLLRKRRETSKRVFTASTITAADFADSMNQSTEARADDILQEIDRSGYIYLEEFVRDRLIAGGFNANLTRHTGDGGADIVVRDELGEIVYLVQCKHTTNTDTPIDAGLLEDARRVRNNWRASGATVIGVTNARRFSPSVITEFKKINGRLIARDELWRLQFSD